MEAEWRHVAPLLTKAQFFSTLLFSVYLDDLLKDLRKRDLGCHIGGLWFGACGYADDLILLAPNRDVLQRMLQVCEVYAADHNLTFSTDPVPARSKTKCLLFCGKSPRQRFPDPLQLNGEDLPWVEAADHLGHTPPWSKTAKGQEQGLLQGL